MLEAGLAGTGIPNLDRFVSTTCSEPTFDFWMPVARKDVIRMGWPPFFTTVWSSHVPKLYFTVLGH